MAGGLQGREWVIKTEDLQCVTSLHWCAAPFWKSECSESDQYGTGKDKLYHTVMMQLFYLG